LNGCSDDISLLNPNKKQMIEDNIKSKVKQAFPEATDLVKDSATKQILSY
jgi:uncharacterized protein YdhG (YjbR/CyaY superfamily)